jgi:hypothetical protein
METSYESREFRLERFRELTKYVSETGSAYSGCDGVRLVHCLFPCLRGLTLSQP